MRTTVELARAAQEAFDLVRAQGDVSEVEVFAAANGSLLTRLNYTSHIPCNGVEEPMLAKIDEIAEIFWETKKA